MRLTSPALVLDVADMASSRNFLHQHLAFRVAAAADDFTVLDHEDHGLRLIFRSAHFTARAGLERLQVGFLVTGIDGHWARLKDHVTVEEPIQTLTALNERYFKIRDPNGVAYRLVEFVS